METTTLSAWLRSAMTGRKPGMTLGELQRDAGVSKSLLSRMLNDPNYRPTAKTLEKLATFFNASYDDLWNLTYGHPPRLLGVRRGGDETGVLAHLRDEELDLPGWLLVWLRELEERGLNAVESASVLQVAERYLRKKAQQASQVSKRGETDPGVRAVSDPSDSDLSAADVAKLRQRYGLSGCVP